MTFCSLLSAATCAAISSAPAAGDALASGPPSQCPHTRAAAVGPESESAAQADAAALLGELRLPPGAGESSSDPDGTSGLLEGAAFGPPAAPNAVDEHAWWLVPAAPLEVLAYICAHLPPGATLPMAEGGGLSGPNVPENLAAGFTWPESPGTLVVWAVRLANGSTALRVDAEVVWVTPRLASERISAGARLLTISVHEPGGRGAKSRSKRRIVLGRLPSRVTSVARIEKIVALLNGLPAQQPGIRLCPIDRGGNVQLSFHASPSASPLAVADINTEGCGGVSLTIDGVAQPGLGGDESLIEEIGRALEIRPAPEETEAPPPTSSNAP